MSVDFYKNPFQIALTSKCLRLSGTRAASSVLISAEAMTSLAYDAAERDFHSPVKKHDSVPFCFVF